MNTTQHTFSKRNSFNFVDVSITRWEPDFEPLERFFLDVNRTPMPVDGWEYMGTDDLDRVHYRRRGLALAHDRRLRLDYDGNHA